MPTRSINYYSEDDLVPQGARTASGDSGVWDGFGRASTLLALLSVTAASGTSPNLTVFIEDTLDGINWFTVGTFAARTAVGTETINVTSPFADRIRARWAISGTTPSFTFSLRVAAQDPSVA